MRHLSELRQCLELANLTRRGWFQTVGLVWFAGRLTGQRASRELDPDPAVWSELVEKGIRFLRASQQPDGSFSPQLGPGITAVVVTGLLKTGRVSPQEPWVRRALGYLEQFVRPTGGIHGERHDAYTTSVALMAFAEANKDGRYSTLIREARRFLQRLQVDEGEGYGPEHPGYGGIGYDSRKRPDLSNTQLALEALVNSGLPQDDPSFRKAVIFLSRCQNFTSEYNTLPFAARVNDGGFIYTPVEGGYSMAGGSPESGWRSYGSMTYAGLKSMIYCGLDRNDPRIQAAVKWIRENYTLEHNPGMPPGRELHGLYYYYHTMAKALHTWGEDPFVDAKGRKHAWRRELVDALQKRQRPDGSWVNQAERWFEGDPNLVTGYALMTLSYCRPRSAAQ
jgi:squalene-hopene/tetraprenyl-beta-curcumene cyclase